MSVLNSHNVFDKFQCGYCQLHVTETALLRVSGGIMVASDAGKSTILVLLDVSGVYDTVYQQILLNRLRDRRGISGTALDWFRFYLSERSFSVAVGHHISVCVPLSYGVPQGSVLGPILCFIHPPSEMSFATSKNIPHHM